MRLLGTGLNPVKRIPGLKLWLRGDRGVTQGSGTVSAWADQSPSGYDLTSVSSTKPTYVSNAKNGIPGVQFVAASSTWLGRRANAPCFSSAFTQFWVLKGQQAVAQAAWLCSHGPGNIAGIGFESDAAPNWRVQRQGTASDGDGAANNDNYHVFSARAPDNSTHPDFRIDGTQQFAQGAGNWSQPDQTGTVPTWTAEINLGAQDSTSAGVYSEFSDCTWCEWIIYNSNLSDLNLTRIEHYLKVKYAL